MNELLGVALNHLHLRKAAYSNKDIPSGFIGIFFARGNQLRQRVLVIDGEPAGYAVHHWLRAGKRPAGIAVSLAVIRRICGTSPAVESVT